MSRTGLRGAFFCAPGGLTGPMKSLAHPFRLGRRLWSPVADHQLAPSEAEGSLHYDMSLPANLASPLEYVVTKNAPVSALESVLTKTKDLNFLGINTYKKQGVGPPLFCLLCCWGAGETRAQRAASQGWSGAAVGLCQVTG